MVFGRWCSWAGTPREGQREPLVFLKFLPVSVTMVPSSSREAWGPELTCSPCPGTLPSRSSRSSRLGTRDARTSSGTSTPAG